MKCVIEIDINTEYLVEQGEALSLVLKNLAEKVGTHTKLLHMQFPVRDSNGNKVGTLTVTN